MKLIAERKIDELGRIVIPSEIRQKLGIENLSAVAIYEDDEKIILQKSKPSCKLCGDCEDINEELCLCRNCIKKIKEY